MRDVIWPSRCHCCAPSLLENWGERDRSATQSAFLYDSHVERFSVFRLRLYIPWVDLWGSLCIRVGFTALLCCAGMRSDDWIVGLSFMRRRHVNSFSVPRQAQWPSRGDAESNNLFRFRLLEGPRKRFIGHIIEHPPLCLMTHSHLSIQFWNTLWNASKVRSSKRFRNDFIIVAEPVLVRGHDI
jgi:hypothetical protein